MGIGTVNIGPNYNEQVALGLIKGARGAVYTGLTTSAAMGTIEDIKTSGGNLVYLDAAELIDISSTSVNDTLLGTGVRKVAVIGLDNDLREITETVEMNGVTPVSTTLEYKRVNLLTAMEVGSLEENEGDVSAIDQSLNIQNQIGIGHNVSKQQNFTIPVGFRGIFKWASISTGKNDECIISYTTRSAITKSPFLLLTTVQVFSSALVFVKVDTAIPAGTDVKILAEAITNNPKIATTIALNIIPE